MGAPSYIFRPFLAARPSDPVGWTGGLKLGGYLGALWLVSTTHFFRSPDDLINCLHKAGLFLRDLTQGRSFSEAYGEFSEKAYNARAAQDREFASLGGWRNGLRPVVTGSMIAVGVVQTAREGGRWFQTPERGTPAYTKFVEEFGERMPLKRLTVWMGAFLALYLGARWFADCWGNARGRKTHEGTCDSNPENFDSSDFNWNFFSSEWAMMTFLAPAHSRGATVAGNAVDVLYHKIGNWVHQDNSSFRYRLLGRDFLPTSHFTKVRAEAINIPAGVREGLKAGLIKGPLGVKLILAGLALGVVGVGIWGAVNVIRKEKCNPYRDWFFVLMGGVALATSTTIFLSPSAGKAFDATTYILRHIFRAPRLSHLFLFTLVGATNTTAINFTLRYTQGLRNRDYYIQNGLRSIYGPMPNRTFGNVWYSLRLDPLGRIEFFMPGQILFYQTVEILTQPKETLSLKYRQIAGEYRNEKDPEDIRYYRSRLVKKERDLVQILQENGINIAQLEEYYRRMKLAGEDEEKIAALKRMPIYRVIRSEALAEQYVNILGIQEEFFLTQDELHQEST